MEWWFAGVMGVVQGLTEFLPISSTAHLRIAPEIFDQPDPGVAYSAVIQLGTLLAVMVYFAKDLFVTMPKALFSDPKSADGRLPLYIIAGTIPIVILGLSFKDFVTGDARSLYVVASMLAGVGVIMFIADRIGRCDRVLATITLMDAMIIGMAQACAIVPGVSRSGATITAALFLGLRRSDSARFSFLLGIPAIAGAGIFEMRDAFDHLGSDAIGPLVIGTTAAAISGYASIAWLLRYLGRKQLAPFALYRIAIGIVLLTLCIAGLLEPRSG